MKKLILIIASISLLLILLNFNINHYISVKAGNKYSIHHMQPGKPTKKIWQTAQKERSSFINEFMDTWKNIPEWEYNFIENSDTVEYLRGRFLELNFSKIVKEREILTYDLFRYVKVYDEGGLYVDSDVEKADEFEVSMSQLSGCNVILGLEADVRNRISWRKVQMARDLQICQWSLYAAPKHQMMKFVNEKIAEKLRYFLERPEEIDYDDVLELTGPGIWTDSVKDYLKLTAGVDIDKKMKCGKSYKYNDICILNINGFALTAPHSCGFEPEPDNFILSYHYF